MVSMALDSSHRDIMGESCEIFILTCNEDSHKISVKFEIQQGLHRLIMEEML